MPNTHPIHAKAGFISDMDGVIYHGNTLLPGANEFIAWMTAAGKKFLFLILQREQLPEFTGHTRR